MVGSGVGQGTRVQAADLHANTFVPSAELSLHCEQGSAKQLLGSLGTLRMCTCIHGNIAHAASMILPEVDVPSGTVELCFGAVLAAGCGAATDELGVCPELTGNCLADLISADCKYTKCLCSTL